MPLKKLTLAMVEQMTAPDQRISPITHKPVRMYRTTPEARSQKSQKLHQRWQHKIEYTPIEELEVTFRKMKGNRQNTLNEKYNACLIEMGFIEGVDYVREKGYKYLDHDGWFSCLVDFVFFPETPYEQIVELFGCWVHRCRQGACAKKKNTGYQKTIDKTNRKLAALNADGKAVAIIWEHEVDAYLQSGELERMRDEKKQRSESTANQPAS